MLFRSNNGNRQTRQVQKVRWEFSSGSIDHFFDDELVAASKGVAPEKLASIEPFPTIKDLVPYDPGYVSGWLVERYQIDPVAAAQHSREVMNSKVRAMCDDEVPGDTHRNLNVSADYSGQTFKHILVPVWLLTYDYGARAFQVVINGYTGSVAGDFPKSWVKILLLVIFILGMLALAAVIFGRR